MLETDDLSGYTCIGIARIAETRQDKNILLDDKYIPTVLDCQAAPRLNGFIVELAGMLRHRAEAIAGRLADTAAAARQKSPIICYCKRLIV